jgi:ABC-type transport system involved in cytochrome c biogenesis ATPase subunit
MREDEDIDSQAEASAPTARQLLIQWANKQDGWVRQLAFEVLASGRAPSDEALAGIYALFLVEKSLADGTPETIPALAQDESSADVSGGFTFVKLENLQGVNALTEGQEIEFNPGLTILFGENGTGKTGYARVLKTLAGVRTAETILPNVHDPTHVVPQEASITFAVGEDEQTLTWRGESGVPPITQASVFDSPAVRLHVDDDLAYVYTPRDLALFHVVSEGIDSLQLLLEGDAAEHEPSGNPYLQFFKRGTTVYPHVETLGPATDIQVLTEFASVTEKDEKDFKSLKETVAALESDSIPAQLAAARSRMKLYGELATAADVAATFDSAAYIQSVEAVKAGADAYANLRAELLASAGIEDRSQEAWQDFVLAGDAYRAHIGNEDYPHDGDACIYCRQPLGREAVELLKRYREFASDATRSRIEAARTQTGTVSRHLKALDLPSLHSAVTQLREDNPDDQHLTDAESLLAKLDLQQPHWQAGANVNWTGVASAATAIKTEATTRRDAAESVVSDLTQRSSDRAETLRIESARLAELTDRRELKTRLPEITTAISNHKWAQRAGQLIRAFPALKRSLTEVSKTASEQLLNADFERRFEEERKVLRAPIVKLEFPGRRGQPARRKVVSADHKPSQVLSEGEQKVIALADFLAEAALRLIPAPIIFDDPVNSLDYRRIHEVATRIAQLAATRQVILFTHSIWLATELLDHFEKDKDWCKYYSVTEDAGGKGIVLPGNHPRWDSVKTTTKAINTVLASAQATEGEAQQALIESAYSKVRAWCEVVVEMELLQGVTQRYQANVMMTRLAGIKADRLDAAISVIDPIFLKACRIMDGHSQPLETLSVRPTLEEMEKDWADLQAARTAYLA